MERTALMAVIKKEKGNKQLEKTKMIISRIIAVFAASGLSVVGAGSLVGIELWQSASLAGALGVATVCEALARAYLADGKLTTAEIDQAFSLVDKGKTSSAS
jgi:hypothetical protein